MMMKFRGVFSSLRLLPGSSPQGTVLGVILFIIYFNGAALRPEIPRPVWPFFNTKKNDPEAVKLKFVDDLSIAVKVSLDDDLIVNLDRPKPLAYDARLETELKGSNILQSIMDNLAEFSRDRQMKMNTKKSCIMKICKSRTKFFPTEIRVGDDEFLEVKKELKILGIIIQPNLKWNSNTESICKKAYRNMWTIRRMKVLGMDTFALLDYYMKEVRVHLELAVPVWHSGLTLKLSSDIERVQRVAVKIILDDRPYEQACSSLGLKPLSIRRMSLCERFALKTADPISRHSDMFKPKKNIRTGLTTFREHFCRKGRFFKSPLPFLTRTLNGL